VRKVTSRVAETAHRQNSVPFINKVLRELRYQREQITRIHASLSAAAITTRLAHSVLPLVDITSARVVPNYAERGSGWIALNF
jgi:hypothetical protein